MKKSLTPNFYDITGNAMANIDFWINEVDKLPEKNIQHLKANLPNLASAFEFGIISPVTFELAVKLLIRISPIIASLPEVDIWIELVNAAINNAPEWHQDEICILHNQLGYMYLLDNQPKKMRESHFSALTYAIIAGNIFEGANARLGIANSYREHKHYQSAKRTAQGVIADIRNNSGLNSQRVAALNILGMVAQAQKHYAEARKYFGTMLKIYYGKPKGRQHAMAQCNLAITHFAEENFAACLKLLAKSRKTLSKWPDSFWTMKLDYVFGITFLKLGEYEKAEKCIQRAIIFCYQHSPSPNLLRHLYQCLEFALRKSAKYTLADIYLEKSENLLNYAHHFPTTGLDDALLQSS